MCLWSCDLDGACEKGLGSLYRLNVFKEMLLRIVYPLPSECNGSLLFAGI